MVTNFFANIPKSILLKVKTLDLNIKSESCNKEINSLLGRTVLLGGKRLRPLLTYLMGNFYGLNPDELAPFAKAIELVHAASLSHDDVVDNATMRRGKPSINMESSNKRAVLAGDYLLADVIVELTNQGNLQLVKEMAQVISALAEGEWIQLDASENRQYTHEVIEKVAICKTASVMSYCCVAPAILKGLDGQLVQYSRKFGENLGIAFQLMDDTLDFSGNSKKDHLLDVKNGVINSVLYEWLLLNPELKNKFENGEDIIDLLDQTDLDQAIETVKTRAMNLLDECRNILDVLIEEMPNASDKDRDQMRAAKKPLLMILDYLAQRKY